MAKSPIVLLWLASAVLLGATAEHCSFRGKAAAGDPTASNRKPDAPAGFPDWSKLPRPTASELEADRVHREESDRDLNTSWSRDDDGDGVPEAVHAVLGDMRELKEYSSGKLEYVHRSIARRPLFEWRDENTDGHPEKVTERVYDPNGALESMSVLMDDNSDGVLDRRFVKFVRAGHRFRRNDIWGPGGTWLLGDERPADSTYRRRVKCTKASSSRSAECLTSAPLPVGLSSSQGVEATLTAEAFTKLTALGREVLPGDVGAVKYWVARDRWISESMQVGSSPWGCSFQETTQIMEAINDINLRTLTCLRTIGAAIRPYLASYLSDSGRVAVISCHSPCEATMAADAGMEQVYGYALPDDMSIVIHFRLLAYNDSLRPTRLKPTLFHELGHLGGLEHDGGEEGESEIPEEGTGVDELYACDRFCTGWTDGDARVSCGYDGEPEWNVTRSDPMLWDCARCGSGVGRVALCALKQSRYPMPNVECRAANLCEAYDDPSIVRRASSCQSQYLIDCDNRNRAGLALQGGHDTCISGCPAGFVGAQECVLESVVTPVLSFACDAPTPERKEMAQRIADGEKP